LTHPCFHDTLYSKFCRKSGGSHRDNHHFQRMIVQKERTAPQHTRSFCRRFTPTKFFACCGAVFFFSGKLHLENFMSRPNVIPALQSTPLQNRGRNFVRSKRRSTYTSSGTLYLFLSLNNSEKNCQKRVLSAAVEGKNRPVATNFQSLKMFCPSGTSLLQCVCISEVILLGRACPKPCLERTRRNCVNLTQFLQL